MARQEDIISCGDGDVWSSICVICKKRDAETHELRLGSYVFELCEDCLHNISAVISKRLGALVSRRMLPEFHSATVAHISLGGPDSYPDCVICGQKEYWPHNHTPPPFPAEEAS